MNSFIILVERYKKAKDWTVSKFSFTGVFNWKGVEHRYHAQQMGYGIEDEVRKPEEKKIHGETAIPSGRYRLTLTYSPKFTPKYYRDDNGNIIEADKRVNDEIKAKYHTKHELILINDIPGFSRVLIHWGNTDDDTEGCYIVGSYEGVKNGQAAVLESRKKYKEIYPIIWRALQSGITTTIELI